MRIAIDVRATQTEHRNRGIGRSILDLVQALMEDGGGHEYGLLVQGALPSPFESLPSGFTAVPVAGGLLGGEEAAWPLRVPRLRSRDAGRMLNDLVLRRRHEAAVRAALRGFRPDVYHATVPIDPFTETVYGLRCRKVVTFYDAIPRLDPAHHYDPQSLLWRRRYDRQMSAVAQADAVVAISESSREEAIRYAGADPARTHVVYLSVSDDFAREACEDVSGFTKGRPYVLFLSPLVPYKNPVNVVKAFARAGTGGRLVMVSTPHGSAFPEVQALTRELGIEDDVTITGLVSDEAVRALVQGATALVSPSFYEGFGLPAAQAMRAGVPAIVSNRKSQPEVVGDAGIVVDPEDVDALAQAMRRVATDPAFRTDLSVRGRSRAALFSYARFGRNMRDVYEGRPPSDPVPRA